MLDREKASLAAAATLGVHEGALRAIAHADRALDFDGYMARPWLKFSALARFARSRAPLQLAGNELIERALEHHRDVAARHGMAQELARPFELGAKLGARREFDAVTLCRERLESVRLRSGAEVRSARAGRRARMRSGAVSGRARAERLDSGRHVRARKPARENDFELTPGLPARFGEEIVGVVCVQVRCQQNHAGEMKPAAPELVEDARKLKGELGHAGSLGGGVFGVAKTFFAVLEDRRASLLEVEPPALDLDQVLDEFGGGFLFGANEQRQTAEQLSV